MRYSRLILLVKPVLLKNVDAPRSATSLSSVTGAWHVAGAIAYWSARGLYHVITVYGKGIGR